MPQVHSTTDRVMHLQVPRYERERGHVVPRPPGRGVGFQGIDGVILRGFEGGAEGGSFGVGEGFRV